MRMQTNSKQFTLRTYSHRSISKFSPSTDQPHNSIFIPHAKSGFHDFLQYHQANTYSDTILTFGTTTSFYILFNSLLINIPHWMLRNQRDSECCVKEVYTVHMSIVVLNVMMQKPKVLSYSYSDWSPNPEDEGDTFLWKLLTSYRATTYHYPLASSLPWESKISKPYNV